MVQRHRARRLHYDFRLEIDGVLASWAVPKGIPLDPGARHLAIHVEDHPIEYFDFEGVIPAGEYGGGDVIVWDRGTWALHRGTDAAAEIRNGELHVDLFGSKLRGRIVLIRTSDAGAREQWLVLHKHDEAARPGWDPESDPRSVLSGRTNEEVAAAPARVWTRDGEVDAARPVPTYPAATPDELDALAGLPARGRWRFQGRDLDLSNLDMVLFPARGDRPPVTKRELIRHAAVVAPVMLPCLEGRPLNLRRYPDGVTRAGFWQKRAPATAPHWFHRWDDPDTDPGERRTYLVADQPAALPWLANHGAVELHPWTSRTDSPARPTWALFDLDPGPDTTWPELLTLARLHRTALEHLGVRGYPAVTGGRGIQIRAPMVEGPTFAEVRAWVETVSRTIGRTVPDLVSRQWPNDRREGRARLDSTQNAVDRTLVAPWAARPAPGGPIAVPITWDELDDPDLRADRWTVVDAAHRLDEAGDPMQEALRRPQTLPPLG